METGSVIPWAVLKGPARLHSYCQQGVWCPWVLTIGQTRSTSCGNRSGKIWVAAEPSYYMLNNASLMQIFSFRNIIRVNIYRLLYIFTVCTPWLPYVRPDCRMYPRIAVCAHWLLYVYSNSLLYVYSNHWMYTVNCCMYTVNCCMYTITAVWTHWLGKTYCTWLKKHFYRMLIWSMSAYLVLPLTGSPCTNYY